MIIYTATLVRILGNCILTHLEVPNWGKNYKFMGLLAFDPTSLQANFPFSPYTNVNGMN